MYLETFKESWKKLFTNLELFVPDILLIIVSALIGFFFISQLGLTEVLISSGESLLESEEAFIDFFSTLDPSLIVKAVFYFILFVVITFFVGSGTNVVKFYMMRNLLMKKDLDLVKALKGGAKEFLWKFILMKIIVFALILVALFLVSLISLIGLFGGIVGYQLVLAILGIIALVFLGIWFYFLVPMLFLSKLKVVELFFFAFSFMRKNLKLIVLTFLITLFVGIAASLLLEGVSDYLLVGAILSIVGGIIVQVWTDLFNFMMYSKVEKIKR